jgi:hypothetical protein
MTALTQQQAVGQLEALVYELLDAHDDTAQLAAEGGLASDLRWEVHLDYLRELQRVGRELLAQAGEPDHAASGADRTT